LSAANATQSLVNTALQSIAYANTSDAPPASVQIDWTFSDGNTGSQGEGGALTTTGSTTVSITSVNDAPVLTPATPVLTSITEDDLSNGGQTVASILGNSLSDVDADAVAGIALYGVTGSYGKWQYSLNGGSTWVDVGTVSASSALLLKETDFVRWMPNGTNGTTATLSYYGWDQTTGTAGTKTSVATRGNTTAYSTAGDTATLVVTDVADAPVVVNAIPDRTATEEIPFNYTFAANVFIDVDAGDALSYT
jgi:hypothetical protein